MLGERSDHSNDERSERNTKVPPERHLLINLHLLIMMVVHRGALPMTNECSPDVIPMPKQDMNGGSTNSQVCSYPEDHRRGTLPRLSDQVKGRLVEGKVRVKNKVLVIDRSVLEE